MTRKFVENVKHIKDRDGVIVAVLVDDSFTSEDIERHVMLGMGVAEIRIDLFNNFETDHIIKEIAKFASISTLATIRKISDGGKWDKPEAERIEIFKALHPHVGAVDVELSEPETLKTLGPVLQDSNCDLVGSYHNFEKTPDIEKLSELIEQAKEVNAAAVKIACKVNNEDDNARLALLFNQDHDIPLIIIGIGPVGMPTRISFPALGSLLTYSPSDKILAEYGQVSFSTMVEMLQVLYPDFRRFKNLTR